MGGAWRRPPRDPGRRAERPHRRSRTRDRRRHGPAAAHGVLSCNGYEVVEARNGCDALERLEQCTPDLIVLDLNMPVMDGWQFRAEQLRLLNGWIAAIPVLLVTGADGAGEHAARLKAVGLIEKPFDPEILLVAIKSALRR